eukprot:1178385-Prorocentrum_minimum.AAC.1
MWSEVTAPLRFHFTTGAFNSHPKYLRTPRVRVERTPTLLELQAIFHSISFSTCFLLRSWRLGLRSRSKRTPNLSILLAGSRCSMWRSVAKEAEQADNDNNDGS